jgi:threonine synthase
VQYVTTRNHELTYNWLEALSDETAPDGGFFVPLEYPVFTQSQIAAIAMKNPNQAIADILNLFFDAELTRWDIDFTAGRYPVRLSSMVRRIAIAEMWHNCDWEFSRTVRDVAALVRGSRDTALPVGSWFQVAFRIGVLFGVFGELMRDGIASQEKRVDISVPSGDGRALTAAWYARNMGLPIGHIIICCNENNNLWNLIRQGELRFGMPVRETCTPECDRSFPDDLERLIYVCGGPEEALRFGQCAREGKTYFPEPPTLEKLQDRMYVSVVSQPRVESTIPTIYKNHSYVFGPYSALCYAGLTDYRSHSGSGDHALILSERGALRDDKFVAGEMNVAVQTLHRIL